MTTWPQFRAIPNGTRIFNNGYDQCVALANHFHQAVLGARFVPVDSAHQWWTDFDRLPHVNGVYRKSATPVPGALFVARGGLYDEVNGHIGSVVDVREGGFTTLEQNTGPTAPQRYVYRHFRIRDDNVLGFLIPINNPAEEDIVTPKDKQEIIDGVVKALMNHPVKREGVDKHGKKRTGSITLGGKGGFLATWEHQVGLSRRLLESADGMLKKLAEKLGVK